MFVFAFVCFFLLLLFTCFLFAFVVLFYFLLVLSCFACLVLLFVYFLLVCFFSRSHTMRVCVCVCVCGVCAYLRLRWGAKTLCGDLVLARGVVTCVIVLVT